MERLYRYVTVELREDWCKSKLPYFEVAEAMHRKQCYKLEALMARGIETGELTRDEAAGLVADWGPSHGIPANEVQWNEIPAGQRSYVSGVK